MHDADDTTHRRRHRPAHTLRALKARGRGIARLGHDDDDDDVRVLAEQLHVR